VADGDVGAAYLSVDGARIPLQAGQGLFVEDLADQAEPLVQGEPRPIRDGDACGLLSPVLERVQPHVRQPRHRRSGRIDPDDATLLARAMGLVHGKLGGVRRPLGDGGWQASG
jgi:hypothetical protein